MSDRLRYRPCALCDRPCVASSGICRRCKEDAARTRDRQTLLAEIRNWHQEHNQVPASRDIPSGHKGRRLFGSWNEAVREAGFEPVEQGRNIRPPEVPAKDRIPLMSHRKVVAWALVDPEDYDLVAGRHWNLGSDGYAYGRINGRQTAMHRVILELRPGDDLDCDHVNGVRLDNRRQNLRKVTRAQNLENRTVPNTGKSRFRGVVPHQDGWMAKGSRENRTVYIGIFRDEVDAAIAAQEWRDQHMPFAQPDPALAAELSLRAEAVA